MKLIDTHAHIYSDEVYSQIDEVIGRWKEAGVVKVFMPNIDHTSIERMLEIEERNEGCHAMMGLHPCYVKEDYLSELKTVKDWFGKRNFCAVGEIGIDLYWEKKFADEQVKAFEYQIELAKDANVPVVIHSRESLDMCIGLIERHQNGNLKGVFHCYTGTAEQAKRIIDLDFYMGIGGVITYKNSDLGNVVKDISIEKIVLETDSPYLPPVPYRGKVNEPSYLKYICEKIAESKQMEYNEVANTTTDNANNLFGQTPKTADL